MTELRTERLLLRPVTGTVSLDLTDGLTQPGGPRRAEGALGYIFEPAHAGHGCATEAVLAGAAMAFDNLGWIDGATYALLADER